MDDLFPVGVEACGLLAQLEADETVLHITSDEARAEALGRFLRQVLPDRQVEMFPPWDCLPFDSASPSPAAMGRRMAALRRLSNAKPGCLVVVSLPALLQRLPPKEMVRGFELRSGEGVDIEALRTFCGEAGYLPDDRIDEPGEVAFRDGTVETFPAGEDLPCRIEFAEDRVVAIRRFDPISQRSIEEIERLDLVPASELPPCDEERSRAAEHRLPEVCNGLTMLPDHLSAVKMLAFPAVLKLAADELTRLAEAQADAVAGGTRPLPVDALYLGRKEWAALARQVTPLEDPSWDSVPAFASERRPRNLLADFLASEAVESPRLLIIAHSDRELRRVQRMMRQAGGAEPRLVAHWSETSGQPCTALLADLDRGFMLKDLTVFAAADLLGSRAEQVEGPMAKLPSWQMPEVGFELGDTVVHEDHGLARLEGIEPLDHGHPGPEVIRLVFAREERLLVPTRDAGRIWRYGTGDAGAKLDRLDAGGWAKRRDATEVALQSLAENLVCVAEERGAARTQKIVPPVAPFERFVSRFPHPATQDQRHAVRAVLDDLASGRPMDRLLIGDVGFGKTEVALRAAAAAALAGVQVAVAAPTTVLARQHFETFRRRFAPFGIEVGHLSRLVTGKAATALKAGLADGSIGIVVGTHALIGNDVRFANLGLLVIDEEQRFGAAQKHKLRALGRGSHVLSMTATPIPRTLQAAVVGLHDLSVLAAPPARRRPIRTLVAEPEDATLRQALLRESRRGGQSFVVVPRVEDIEPTAERLRNLIPRLRLRIAHGELPAREIDATMVGFASGDGDVLLATAIIESGLDVARANTMLIMRPTLFGLAQLHQLRGRVGRGGQQAYCYLLTAEGETMGDDAQRRLGTLQTMDRLGAGFAISVADLDRRGAGDLLGDQQKGHVRRVGLGLYQQMLGDALQSVRGRPSLSPPPQVLGEAGYIPECFVPEPEQRIDLYHRIARARLLLEVEELADEIVDRFGPMPPPFQALIRVASARALAGALGVEQINLGPEGTALGFADAPEARNFDKAVRRTADLEWDGERLLLRRAAGDPADQLDDVIDLLERLA